MWYRYTKPLNMLKEQIKCKRYVFEPVLVDSTTRPALIPLARRPRKEFPHCNATVYFRPARPCAGTEGDPGERLPAGPLPVLPTVRLRREVSLLQRQ